MSQVRYHRVPEWFWPLAQKWDDKTRVLGLYLQTCKHRTTEGLYLLPLGYPSADLGWTVKEVERQMAFVGTAGLIKYDSDVQVVLLPFALEIQAPTAPGQIKGAIKRLKEVPRSPLLRDLYGYASTHSSAFAEAIRVEFPSALEWAENGHAGSKPSTHSRPQALALSTSSRTEG